MVAPVPGWLALAVEVALVEVARVVGVEVLPLVLLAFHQDNQACGPGVGRNK